jgi:hypothetical protein
VARVRDWFAFALIFAISGLGLLEPSRYFPEQSRDVELPQLKMKVCEVI